MRRRLLKTLTTLALSVLMIVSVISAFVLGIGADKPINALAEGDTYQLVTDASTLKAGDSIIIAASASDVALSTTQNSNNRGQAAITKENDKITLTSSSTDVQIITLEEGTTTGTFAFNVGTVGTESYLYAASSGKNYLRTQTKKDANGSWDISITDGVATIKAQGTNTRNLLCYNSSSKLFSCYASE